ncbi:MAG: hypothetical protein IPI05_05210 [Flavobacteriales bacterium]|nr:hypothetical protein [Flavobacteriales bacterium]
MVATPGDSLSGDTLRRLDITCAGEHAQYPDPVVWEMKDQYAHFYLPSCAPDGATFVHPYHRVIYPGIYPHIDMHIYSGMVGQKIAFVINPEGHPKDIELKFTGQDQMDVDIYGNLKLLLEGEWVTIPQAMAYQVANDGSIIPVNWTAGYDAYENVGRAYFNFSNYDHGKPLVFLVGPPALGGNTIYEEEGLCWSTYYGAEDFDMLTDIKPDSEGNFYVAGRTESPILNFPSVTGTSITPGDVHSLATLTKFNQSHLLQWTAFLGNSNIWNGGYTEATGLAIKADPVRIYLVGNTASFNFFPTFLAGAYNEVDPHNTQDKGFLARFDDQKVRDWATIYGMSKVQIHAVDVVPHADRTRSRGPPRATCPGSPERSSRREGRLRRLVRCQRVPPLEPLLRRGEQREPCTGKRPHKMDRARGEYGELQHSGFGQCAHAKLCGSLPRQPRYLHRPIQLYRERGVGHLFGGTGCG